jgi:trehalose/maltose hydrolase-like predicted phosphorylase
MKDICITYNNWKPEEQKLREALCTLGNGYFATRGAAEESRYDDCNYPGTYLAGGFDRAKTEISGRWIENEDFVNFPNWLCLNFRPEDGEWMDLNKFKVHEYTQSLDMKNGLLIREFKVEDNQGRCTYIKSRRLVSMSNMHLAAIEWQLTTENWSGDIELYTALDGTVTNAGVERYADLESQHLEPLMTREADAESMLLMVRTRQSKYTVAMGARTCIYNQNIKVDTVKETHQREGYIDQKHRFNLKQGKTYTIEKMIALYTSRDRASTEPSHEACKALKRMKRFKEAQMAHISAWDKLWRRADIGLIDGEKTQKLLRLHIFHILQTVSLHSIGLDVGVPSRGLHGEAYRGHIFWDEIYIFPFLNLRFPEITYALLMYRFNRLEEARYAARQAGYKGAMFPWQSGSNGREESQEMHLNPKSGRWKPDDTHLQRHVNAAIAYNIWNYYQATDDIAFLSIFGAEMFFSIASFWASRVTYNEASDRYEIHQVVGPDEYHTSYPDSDKLGLNNNAYTNIMVAWLMQKALHIKNRIQKSRVRELMNDLDINQEELSLWDEISQKMYVPFGENGLILQFDGYQDLQEFPWETYRKKYKNIQRLDRVLESENDTPNRYKASKQADVLMLFYLFNLEQLQEILKKLGHDFSREIMERNIDYYKARTSHGSTLSRFVFSWILYKYDKKTAWQNFEKLLISDFEDIQGGTTEEGIHLGAMAGSLDLIQRVFTGIEVTEEALWIKPDLPRHVQKINLQIKYRHHWIGISVDHDRLRIAFEEGYSNEVKIGVFDEIHPFAQGDVRTFKMPEK